MKIKTTDYCIEYRDDDYLAVFTGVMRLVSPLEYENPFAQLYHHIGNRPPLFTIDISGLEFLNSSGLTALSRVVLFSRKQDTPLKIIARKSIPWQMKSLNSISPLWDKLQIEII